MFQVVIADSKMLKMKDTQKKYRMLVDRYNHFMSQNESFFSVLEKCRVNISPATKCIKSIYQVEHYLKYVADNKVDRRICFLFLELVRDLDRFRQELKNLANDDPDINDAFLTMKKALDPLQDISRLNSPYSKPYVLKLPNYDAHVKFSGIISVLPVAINCANKCIEIIRGNKSYIQRWNKFTISENLAKLSRYNENEAMKLERFVEIKKLKGWQMPNRMANKIKLVKGTTCKPLRLDNVLLPLETREVATQKSPQSDLKTKCAPCEKKAGRYEALLNRRAFARRFSDGNDPIESSRKVGNVESLNKITSRIALLNLQEDEEEKFRKMALKKKAHSLAKRKRTQHTFGKQLNEKVNQGNQTYNDSKTHFAMMPYRSVSAEDLKRIEAFSHKLVRPTWKPAAAANTYTFMH